MKKKEEKEREGEKKVGKREKARRRGRTDKRTEGVKGGPSVILVGLYCCYHLSFYLSDE